MDKLTGYLLPLLLLLVPIIIICMVVFCTRCLKDSMKMPKRKNKRQAIENRHAPMLNKEDQRQPENDDLLVIVEGNESTDTETVALQKSGCIRMSHIYDEYLDTNPAIQNMPTDDNVYEEYTEEHMYSNVPTLSGEVTLRTDICRSQTLSLQGKGNDSPGSLSTIDGHTKYNETFDDKRFAYNGSLANTVETVPVTRQNSVCVEMPHIYEDVPDSSTLIPNALSDNNIYEEYAHEHTYSDIPSSSGEVTLNSDMCCSRTRSTTENSVSMSTIAGQQNEEIIENFEENLYSVLDDNLCNPCHEQSDMGNKRQQEPDNSDENLYSNLDDNIPLVNIPDCPDISFIEWLYGDQVRFAMEEGYLLPLTSSGKPQSSDQDGQEDTTKGNDDESLAANPTRSDDSDNQNAVAPREYPPRFRRTLAFSMDL